MTHVVADGLPGVLMTVSTPTSMTATAVIAMAARYRRGGGASRLRTSEVPSGAAGLVEVTLRVTLITLIAGLRQYPVRHAPALK